MGGTITETGSVSTAREWVSGLWTYYRQYTHSAIHAASAAALTIFGLLVFIDPLFAAVAIAAYVCPPIVLYVLGVEVGAESEAASTERPGDTDSVAVTDSTRGSERGARDSDSDSDGGDSDSDSDSDGADGDSDSDSDDGDSDSDGADGDSDSDGSDTDSDGVSVD
ncbi:hypothetical protein [Halohasta litorea]|uniref:Uncharacterized protein n=1 Tax=Halohasta litorea TaxID=869891 RepID=A0ABD6D2I5_9EURY|nr:hypothetical protein [Halohasta litorea]